MGLNADLKKVLKEVDVYVLINNEASHIATMIMGTLAVRPGAKLLY
ncbi:MAG: hypothetical protein ACYDAP_04230 [Thermoplasmataceae archaeon]